MAVLEFLIKLHDHQQKDQLLSLKINISIKTGQISFVDEDGLIRCYNLDMSQPHIYTISASAKLLRLTTLAC